MTYLYPCDNAKFEQIFTHNHIGMWAGTFVINNSILIMVVSHSIGTVLLGSGRVKNFDKVCDLEGAKIYCCLNNIWSVGCVLKMETGAVCRILRKHSSVYGERV